MKKILIVIIFLCLSTQSILAQSTSNLLSKEEVLEDLDYLYKSLIEAHYQVYAYVTEQDFKSTYQKVKGSIEQDSLSLLETTTAFQQLISAINNGHTEITFPGQSYAEYAYSGGTVFPLEIAFENGKPLIRKNWSKEDQIKLGSELISVNGIPISDILSKIYPQISAERPYFKQVKLELFSFPRYYWQLFGMQDSFRVEIESKGTRSNYTLDAIRVIEDFEMKRDEILNTKLELKFLGNSAYLNTGNFGGDEQAYQKFIDSAFVEIRNNKSENLILDLRNNGGGDNSYSDYLISYFADRPFTWNSKFTLKTSSFLKDHVRKNNDTTTRYSREILSHKNGEIFDFTFEDIQPQPLEKRFTGEVFVLVNRQSHSQSAVTAAQIQDYRFGKIVGEETGDYPSLYASVFRYKLPNSGIEVQVSKGYIVRVNGSTAEEGVIPDIYIKDYLLDEKDEILEGLLKRLN
ncbi:peptidase S41 [Algoriphagus lutimaris]|uniref:S41 family peptidase n=1 Tax=Algoriphagus lutimaris TaxID=613197 RepID=UPI00196BA31E|nr:S41 family peptidase [Algoriphagus lutimaris]MBN3519432.1 peptidase S41 [Algoriphagus lutimaris]